MAQLNCPCNHTKSSSHVRKWKDLRWQRHETPCHSVLSSITCGRQREHNQKLEVALSCTLGLPRWPSSGRSGGWHHRCQMFAFAISLESILRQRKLLSSWCSCVLSLQTFRVYAVAPRMSTTSVMSTQVTPICWFCTCHPYVNVPWATGIIVKIARLPNVPARIKETYDPRKCGWKVDIEQITANTESYSVSALRNQRDVKIKPESNKHCATVYRNKTHSRAMGLWHSTSAESRLENQVGPQTSPRSCCGLAGCDTCRRLVSILEHGRHLERCGQTKAYSYAHKVCQENGNVCRGSNGITRRDLLPVKMNRKK